MKLELGTLPIYARIPDKNYLIETEIYKLKIDIQTLQEELVLVKAHNKYLEELLKFKLKNEDTNRN